MDIEKLYEEMGRELARWQALTTLEKQESQEYQDRRKQILEKLTASRDRLEMLNEAVQLAQHGTDPLLAKMVAKDNLDERIEAATAKSRSGWMPSLFGGPRFPLPELKKDDDDGCNESADTGC
jgi:hypothetical protein